MQNPLSHALSYYIRLVKRWIWVIALGVLICGAGTYLVSLFIPPTYQASAYVFVNLGSSNTSAYDNTSASLAALPTYAQLITNPTVLTPVTWKHPGLTLSRLTSMITVTPQTSTQLIKLDIQSKNPQEAMQLANDVSENFASYANTQFPSSVQVIPAPLPTSPIRPKPLQDAGIGALVGLGLALALIVIFEWIDDRIASPEEVQEILGLDTLTIIPELSHEERTKFVEKIPTMAEGCHMLSASLIAAQAINSFKLVMVTSALPGEGKSSIAANVASFLAMVGKRVLLVDANLRYPALDRHFQLDNYRGFSNALTLTQIGPELDGQPTDNPILRVLPAGSLPGSPAELLQSRFTQQLFDHFKQTAEFDYVIFDAPPLLPVADAQILASYIPATVLVVDASKTPRKFLLRAKRVLDRTRTRVIGVVLNKSPWPEDGDIRRYLSGMQQPKIDINVMMPANKPSMLDGNTAIPNTSPLNGTVDPDITIAIPRRQNSRGEKS